MRRLLVAAVALVVAVLAGGFAYFALGGDAPAPPRLDVGRDPTAAGGHWRPVAGTFAGYRVQETYLGAGVRTAVGRTTAVTGGVDVAGGRVRGAILRADLTRLRSDKAQRDDTLRTRGLETGRFPRATFTLREPVALTGGRGAGTLALHGRRATVTVTMRGRAAGNRLELVGAVPITFADFGIEPPSVAGLVTVRDRGTLEFRLVLRRGA